jgi:hypothetical protein
MQSHDTRLNDRLHAIQKVFKRLEQQLDNREREEFLRERHSRERQHHDRNYIPSVDNRLSVTTYNHSMRWSFQVLEMIISSSSALSRMPSMAISEFIESPFWTNRSPDLGAWISDDAAPEAIEDGSAETFVASMKAHNQRAYRMNRVSTVPENAGALCLAAEVTNGTKFFVILVSSLRWEKTGGNILGLPHQFLENGRQNF